MGRVIRQRNFPSDERAEGMGDTSGLLCLDDNCIVGTSEYDVVCSWNAASGLLVSKSRKEICDLGDPCPPVTSGWVVADRFAAKLPPMIQVHLMSKKAASRTSIAFGTDDGQLIIIHHPSGISTRPLIEHIEESISGGSYQLNSVTDGELDINQHRLEELQDFQVIDRQDTFLSSRKRGISSIIMRQVP